MAEPATVTGMAWYSHQTRLFWQIP